MELTFAAVQDLPVAIHPEWEEHQVQKFDNNDLDDYDDDDDDDDNDDEGEAKPRKKQPTQSRHQSLGLHRKQYESSNWTTEEHLKISLRELFTNLLDQAGENNGTLDTPSFEGMWFVSGKRKDKDVICLHNGSERLAEIIHCERPKQRKKLYFSDKQPVCGDDCPEYSTLSFVNYGAVLKSQSQVLSIGNSGKHGKSNQVGIHGEGLKTAILRLLHCGIGIEINCCVRGFSSTPITQRWRPFISTDLRDAGVLCVTTSNFKMPELVKGAHDRVRFVVTLTYNRTMYRSLLHRRPVPPQIPMLGFSMDNYLIDRAHLRDRRGANDWGSLVPLTPGSIWAWNIFIMNDDENIRFSYNLFISIGRDRDNVKNSIIRNALTHVWNAIFRNPLAVAEQGQFLNLVYPEPETAWFEWRIIPRLDLSARATLRSLLLAKYPEQTHCFLLQAEKEEASRLFAGKEICVLDVSVRDALGFPTLSTIKKLHTDALKEAPVAEDIPYALSTMFREYVSWKNPDANNVILYGVGETVIHINWPLFLKKYPTEDAMFNELVCKVLPNAFPAKWNVTPLLNRPLPPRPESPVVLDDDDNDLAADLTEIGPYIPFKAPAQQVAQKRPREPVAAMAPAMVDSELDLIQKTLTAFLPQRHFKVRKSVFALIEEEEEEEEDDEEEVPIHIE